MWESETAMPTEKLQVEATTRARERARWKLGFASQISVQKGCTFFHRLTSYRQSLAVCRIGEILLTREEIYAVCHSVSR
jgi:hypothetical protein